MDDGQFRLWLKAVANLGEASAGDVVSRVKRASGLINIDAKGDTDELLFKLGRVDEFKNMSITVRSQLRRAVSLYRTFKQTLPS